MSNSNRAVFLSYATQDAVAAKRICDSLRLAGIEVWLDQTELRGGDAWDHKIRQQIQDCGLFIPVISETTAARPEGYFRLEWALADRRTEMIARTRAFIVPVCVDRTPDRGADVPDSFLKVQWTRLPGGETPTSFCARIRVLLAGNDSRVPSKEHANSPPEASRRIRLGGRVAVTAGAFAALAVVGATWWLQRPTSTLQTVATASAAAPAATAVPDKSIAVLPFVDMSEAHNQEYFSDGLSEELINRLAHNRDLKVIARTSSFAFKGKNEDMRSIASKLGVANLLEGSVRKSGSELRITAQLIRASDGAHLWSESYERKLTDIFNLQVEISDTVTKALQVTFSGMGKPSQAEPTSVAAYNFVLKGDFIFKRSNDGDEDLALAQYRRALELDPKYVRAWIRIARIYAAKADSNELPGAEASAEVRKALQHALAINPDSAAAHRALGGAYQVFDWNWAAARNEYLRAADLDPNGPEGLGAHDDLQFLEAMMTGRFNDPIRSAERDLDRNPLDPNAIYNLAAMQFFAGRMQDAALTFQRLLELVPTFREAPSWNADALLILGRPDDALAMAKMETHETDRAAALTRIFWVLGRRAEAEALLRQLESKHADVAANQIARAYAYRGDADSAFKWLDRAYYQHESVMEILKVDPFFERLRGDSRYRQLLRKMNLPEG